MSCMDPEMKKRQHYLALKRAAGRRQYLAILADPARYEQMRARMRGYDTSPRRKKQRRHKVKEIQQWFWELKKTMKCGGTLPNGRPCPEKRHYCLDFHHRDPKKKSFPLKEVIGKKLYGKARILAEIAKCDVRCANCHRAWHWLERHPKESP